MGMRWMGALADRLGRGIKRSLLKDLPFPIDASFPAGGYMGIDQWVAAPAAELTPMLLRGLSADPVEGLSLCAKACANGEGLSDDARERLKTLVGYCIDELSGSTPRALPRMGRVSSGGEYWVQKLVLSALGEHESRPVSASAGDLIRALIDRREELRELVLAPGPRELFEEGVLRGRDKAMGLDPAMALAIAKACAIRTPRADGVPQAAMDFLMSHPEARPALQKWPEGAARLERQAIQQSVSEVSAAPPQAVARKRAL